MRKEQVHQTRLLEAVQIRTAQFHKYVSNVTLRSIIISLIHLYQIQIACTPSLTRNNSLTASNVSIQQLKVPTQFSKYSPALSRKLSYVEPKSVNTFNDRENDKVLPRITLDECITLNESEDRLRYSKIGKFLLMIEPKGCMKERDDFTLYIFPPHNR